MAMAANSVIAQKVYSFLIERYTSAKFEPFQLESLRESLAIREQDMRDALLALEQAQKIRFVRIGTEPISAIVKVQVAAATINLNVIDAIGVEPREKNDRRVSGKERVLITGDTYDAVVSKPGTDKWMLSVAKNIGSAPEVMIAGEFYDTEEKAWARWDAIIEREPIPEAPLRGQRFTVTLRNGQLVNVSLKRKQDSCDVEVRIEPRLLNGVARMVRKLAIDDVPKCEPAEFEEWITGMVQKWLDKPTERRARC